MGDKSRSSFPPFWLWGIDQRVWEAVSRYAAIEFEELWTSECIVFVVDIESSPKRLHLMVDAAEDRSLSGEAIRLGAEITLVLERRCWSFDTEPTVVQQRVVDQPIGVWIFSWLLTELN